MVDDLCHCEVKGKATIGISASRAAELGTAKSVSIDKFDTRGNEFAALVRNLNDKVLKVGIILRCGQLANGVREDRDAIHFSVRVRHLPSVDWEDGFDLVTLVGIFSGTCEGISDWRAILCAGARDVIADTTANFRGEGVALLSAFLFDALAFACGGVVVGRS